METWQEVTVEVTLNFDDVMTLRELELASRPQIGTGDVKGSSGVFDSKVAINNSPDVCRRRALFEKLLAGVKEER